MSKHLIVNVICFRNVNKKALKHVYPLKKIQQKHCFKKHKHLKMQNNHFVRNVFSKKISNDCDITLTSFTLLYISLTNNLIAKLQRKVLQQSI